MNILFFFQFLIDSQQFFHFSYKYQKIKIRAVINHLEIVLQYYTYAYRFILHPFGSFDVRIPLLTQCSQLHLLEQLPLSLCTYPFLFSVYETLVCFNKTGFGSGSPIFNSRVSLNLKVLTWQVSIPRLNPIKSVASTNFAISPFLFCDQDHIMMPSPFFLSFILCWNR